MYGKYLALSALAATTQATASNHWAVIVAGSNGYWNYRHQSDTCHAYQILKANGYQDDHIIHLAFDDIASDPSNPFPGQIFNKPTAAGTPGVDVYKNCKIDYKGNTVTADNVLKVLKGDKTASGPVLGSDENSEVFFYFADHGAPGLIAMPVGNYLYADQLHQAFQYMNQNKMYKKMVVYIEACESGSMFENILENNLNIYATTAANSQESSWGTYCSPDDMVNGKSIGSCLGDLYSVNWLEDADKAKMNTETLQDQFKTVQTETTQSHVMQWGELDWTNLPIGDFEATGDEASAANWWKNLKHKAKEFVQHHVEKHSDHTARKNDMAVNSRDIKLHYLYTRVKSDPSIENMNALQEEIKKRTDVDTRFNSLFPQHMEAIKNKTTPLPTDFECLRTLVDAYETHCEKMDDYSLKWVSAFVAQCEGMKSFPEGVLTTVDKIKTECTAN